MSIKVFNKDINNNSQEMLLQHILDYGKKAAAIYDGSWKAGWLLTDINSASWELETDQTRKVNGIWKGVYRVTWDIVLPDGTKLLDLTHSSFLNTARRISFLIREIHSSKIDSSLTHRAWILSFQVLIQWIYLNRDVYHPDEKIFSYIDTSSINEFMVDLREGGVAWALRLPQRSLQWLYREALETQPDWKGMGRRFQVQEIERNQIIDWLKTNDYYIQKKKTWGDGVIQSVDRRKLAKILHVDFRTLRSSPKFAAFLRQFEPDLLQISTELLLPARGVRQTEYPRHTTPTLEKALSSEYNERSIRFYFQLWRDLLSLGRHFKEQIPDTTEIRIKELNRFSSTGQSLGHTPWVPLRTALSYTNEALKWVLVYGDPLITFYLQAVQEFCLKGWFSYQDNSASYDWDLKKRRDDWVLANLPNELEPLNIGSWTSWFSLKNQIPFRPLREKPSLNDAMELLVAAISITVSVVKPIREKELRLLSRDCLTLKDGDGYWLKQNLRKNNVGVRLEETNKPIPVVAARGITLLKRLADETTEIVEEKDPYLNRSLFYMPQFVRSASLKTGLVETVDLNRMLDRFCDYVGLPTDSLGRRWYYRVHEMRKSFLLTFFWCFKYSALEPARWMAGHSTAEHMHEYIEAEMPGEELTELEAEYATAQLWNYATGKETEAIKVDQLYQAVCKHFKVNRISLLDEKDVNDWLKEAFDKKLYRVQPYSVQSKDGTIDTMIAIRIKEIGDDD